ncbi:oxidoreductase [Penicillium hetheringtonii]|uniref:Oxidoreductase n=1 Tax=Penicillium hetheringtonii TaxID=911720 RepID=A0AAD6DK61_9EURO|nr:oxidoreductase [Penicillium hetheringtonii]
MLTRMNLGAVAETDMGTTPVCLPNEIHSSETSLVNSSTSLLRSVVNLNDFETAASQILPARSFACCGPKQLADARTETQTLYWQIYAMEDLSVTEKEVKDAIDLGYRAFALTVDAIHVGKRERDLRLIIKEEEDLGANQEDDDNGFSGGPTVPRSQVYTDFDWTSAVSWMRKITDLPIAIKGIQSWEDAALCMKHGVHPWLSNHGGRQLEGAPSALDTLLEIRRNCPDVIRHCDVIVDGGIRRGTDIVKALALGARGVGLGRSFLYALAFGKPGVNKAIKILENEVITTMALLGVGSIDQLSPDYVNVDTLNFRNKRPRYSSRL